MAKILDMPKLSPTMEEGVLATWHKKEGDSVEVDDLLAEVETDKATMEFRAFDRGTLLKLLVGPGANVKLGQPVAILGAPGEDVSGLVAQAGGDGGAAHEEPPAETPRSPHSTAATKAEKKEGEATPPQSKTSETMRPGARPAPVPKGNVLTRTERDASPVAMATNGGERVLASPYVRRVARERGIELAGAQGSGEHGRIVPADLDALGKRGDVRGTIAFGVPQPPGAATGRASTALAVPGLTPPEVRPLSPMRKTIARRLTQAKQNVPHFYLTIDVDADELVALRERVNAELAAGGKAPKNGTDAPKPDKISLNDLIVKGCATALVHVPECNAQYTDEAILVHKRVDISIAVAIPDGLVTPVLRNADQKSVVVIAREIRDLAARARAKKLKPEEMSDGTFSVSNLGMFGIDEFSAVINPPEGAILAVGQARDVPVVKDGAVRPGKKIAMTLSCDHRVVDGAVGAAFLAELRQLLERPMRILTG
jgi:pyruvate dehydrogenase E2 component (dihydrolipoamide acetyltransferase)